MHVVAHSAQLIHPIDPSHPSIAMRLATPDLQNPSVPAYYYCRHNKHHCTVFAVRLSVRFATSSPVPSRTKTFQRQRNYGKSAGPGYENENAVKVCFCCRPRRRLLKGKGTYAAAQRGTEIIHQNSSCISNQKPTCYYPPRKKLIQSENRNDHIPPSAIILPILHLRFSSFADPGGKRFDSNDCMTVTV